MGTVTSDWAKGNCATLDILTAAIGLKMSHMTYFFVQDQASIEKY